MLKENHNILFFPICKVFIFCFLTEALNDPMDLFLSPIALLFSVLYPPARHYYLGLYHVMVQTSQYIWHIETQFAIATH